MAVPFALVRVLDELLWRLRREGFVIATPQAIDVLRSLAVIGLDDPRAVRAAVAGVVVSRRRDRAAFDAAFDAFFAAGGGGPRDVWARLSDEGFAAAEIELARAWLDAAAQMPSGTPSELETVLARGADFDWRMSLFDSADTIDEAQTGYRFHQLRAHLGLDRARTSLAVLRARLQEKLGARGVALAGALALELGDVEGEVRSFVEKGGRAARRAPALGGPAAEQRASEVPFALLDEDEVERVRRGLRRLAQRLRARARVRARRAARGRVDVRRTLRRSLRTAGVPVVLVRSRRRRADPKLVVLCDVSESVRTAARFMLEFTFSAQEVFASTRSFVFVSELGETTDLFARHPISRAIELAWRGAGRVRTTENSNYGRALRAFERRHASELDPMTTVVILGDGRTNYADAADDVLERLRARARDLVWLCTEPRSRWGEGDSAMPRYASACSAVYEVCRAADLERVARVMFGARGR